MSDSDSNFKKGPNPYGSDPHYTWNGSYYTIWDALYGQQKQYGKGKTAAEVNAEQVLRPISWDLERQKLQKDIYRLTLDNEHLSSLVEYWQRRAQQNDRKNTPNKTKFSLSIWRKLISLVHPDKHNNSETSAELTRWLLENKPKE